MFCLFPFASQEAEHLVKSPGSRCFTGAFCFDGLYGSPRAVLGKYHNLGCLKQQKCILSEFRSLAFLNQGVGRTLLSVKAVREGLFHAFLSFWCCWKSLVFLGLETCHFGLCPGHFMALSLWVSVFYPLLVRTPVFGLGPSLLQYGIILT